MELVVSVDIVRRFQFSNNPSGVEVTRRTIGAALGGIVTVANTTVAMIVSSYRIRSITVWPAVGSSVLIDVPAIQAGAEQALQKESSKNAIIPTGITVDVPTQWRPHRGTHLDMWQSVGNDPSDAFLTISGASGAVLDLHCVAALGGCVSALTTYTTTTTAAVGLFVCGNLDTSNKIVVIGYNSANY